LQASFGTPGPSRADHADTAEGTGEMTHMTPLELRITLRDLQERAGAERGRRVFRPAGEARLARLLGLLLRTATALAPSQKTPKETRS
jgi:hypothetical protein